MEKHKQRFKFLFASLTQIEIKILILIKRLNEIATILEADKIDLERLKCICFQYGCPNEVNAYYY